MFYSIRGGRSPPHRLISSLGASRLWGPARPPGGGVQPTRAYLALPLMGLNFYE